MPVGHFSSASRAAPFGPACVSSSVRRHKTAMLTNRTDFLARFLHQLRDDWTYVPPTPKTIAQAAAAAKDEIGFDMYRAQFMTLAHIMDTCAAEDLWGGNPLKHPRVLALAKLEASQRAMIAVAAAQGLVWMDQCQKWVQRNTPKESIALRVMAAALLVAGRVGSGYSAPQLAALARIGASSQDMDLVAISARGAIAEILAANIREFPRDKETRIALKQFLDFIGSDDHMVNNLKPVVRAIDKLTPLTVDEHAA